MDRGTDVPMPLEGSLVRLRALEEGDGASLNPLFSDPDVLRNLSMAFPQPMEGYLDFWRNQRADASQLNLAIEVRATGEAVGICGLMELGLNHAPEVGIWLGKPHWNMGYGTDAMRVLCRFAFAELGVHRVTLHVYATNRGAVRAYEKVGFRMEGTQREDMFQDGRWTDTYVMGLLADELIP